MDFSLPPELAAYLDELDAFIEAKIKPLENQDDNIRFFDHRREYERTDWDAGGLPKKEWEELLAKARKLADEAGHLRYAWPKEMGGKAGTNLDMAVIREHLAAKGLGLHNDLQNEHSIVGNNPFILMFKEFATNAQYERDGDKLLNGGMRTGFGLTEPNHGSDATFMETTAVRQDKDGQPGWLIRGEKMWTTGMHVATHVMVFARTSGQDGDAAGIDAGGADLLLHVLAGLLQFALQLAVGHEADAPGQKGERGDDADGAHGADQLHPPPRPRLRIARHQAGFLEDVDQTVADDANRGVRAQDLRQPDFQKVGDALRQLICLQQMGK